MKATRAADDAVREVADDLVLPRCPRRTLLMVVGVDELVFKERNEGGVDNVFHVGEEDKCRCVRGKRRTEAIVDSLVKTITRLTVLCQ